MADGASSGAGEGDRLNLFVSIVALIIGGPTLLLWAIWIFLGLYVLGLAVEVVHFVAAHAAAVGLSLLCGGAFLGGMIWRPRATITVASVLLYGFMAFRLTGGVR